MLTGALTELKILCLVLHCGDKDYVTGALASSKMQWHKSITYLSA